MRQPLPLDEFLGYRLKQVDAALRAAMDRALRESGLTAPQYACLEVLDRTPGASNSDLARGAFVTRQSMNVVVQGLQERGLLTRPARAAQGRARPIELTAAGRRAVEAARSEVERLEQAMASGLDDAARAALASALTACLGGLEGYVEQSVASPASGGVTIEARPRPGSPVGRG